MLATGYPAYPQDGWTRYLKTTMVETPLCLVRVRATQESSLMDGCAPGVNETWALYVEARRGEPRLAGLTSLSEAMEDGSTYRLQSDQASHPER